MKKKVRVLDLLLYFIAVCYIVLLLLILFRRVHFYRSFNIIPFKSIYEYLAGDDLVVRAFAVSNVLGNIVIFIPLGIYLTLFNHLAKRRKIILSVFVFSMLVEVIQYTFKLGIGDIDDVILNVLGGAIGVSIYQLLWLIFKDNRKIRNVIGVCAPICGVLSYFVLIYMI